MSIRECVPCSALTRQGKGAPCKNNACATSEFCASHTRSLFDLVLKPSKIKEAGTGLYTTKDIPKNHNIAKYTGQIKTQEEFDASPSNYGIAIPHKRVMDAKSTQSGLARYANDCRTSNKKDGECKGNNTRFVLNTRAGKTTIWLRATKNITAGSELFVSYGSKYWKN